MILLWRTYLSLSLLDANNSPLPVRCYKQHDQSYWVEFTPEITGEHEIKVTFAETPVTGSPFTCEVVDPKAVVIRGLEDNLHLRHIAKVTVDRTKAGKGQLDFEVKDPHGLPLKVDRLRTAPDVDSFSFLPSKLGSHKLNISFAGFPIQGVPKSFEVEEAGKPKLAGKAAEGAVEVDKPVKLALDTKTAGGLKVRLPIHLSFLV